MRRLCVLLGVLVPLMQVLPAAADHEADEGWVYGGVADEEEARSYPCAAGGIGPVACLEKRGDDWSLTSGDENRECVQDRDGGYSGRCVLDIDMGDHLRVWATPGTPPTTFRVIWYHGPNEATPTTAPPETAPPPPIVRPPSFEFPDPEVLEPDVIRPPDFDGVPHEPVPPRELIPRPELPDYFDGPLRIPIDDPEAVDALAALGGDDDDEEWNDAVFLALTLTGALVTGAAVVLAVRRGARGTP